MPTYSYRHLCNKFLNSLNSPDILPKCSRCSPFRQVNRNSFSTECPCCQMHINQICACDLKIHKRPRKSGCVKTTTHISRKDLENHIMCAKGIKFGKTYSPDNKLQNSGRRIISPSKCDCNDDHYIDAYSSDVECSLEPPYLTSANSLPDEMKALKHLNERRERESLYAKFVYDITQEIMRSKIYTDKEMKNVFKKHLNKNLNTLDKGKMLYEIYQLKISLNLLNDSTDDEEEAEYVFKTRFSNISEAKPPTPPKVLNENKVAEKIINYKELKHHKRKLDPNHSSRNKSVILVDANPELLLTERDLLSSLADSNLEPNQIQHIYKRLSSKTRESHLPYKRCVHESLTSTSKVDDEKVCNRFPTFKDSSNQDHSEERRKKHHSVSSCLPSNRHSTTCDAKNTRQDNEMPSACQKYQTESMPEKQKFKEQRPEYFKTEECTNSQKSQTERCANTEDKEIQNSPETLDHSVEIQEDLSESCPSYSEDRSSSKRNCTVKNNVPRGMKSNVGYSNDGEKINEIDEEISETSYASDTTNSGKKSKCTELTNSCISEDEYAQNSESAKYSEDFSTATQSSGRSNSKSKIPLKPSGTKGPVRIVSKTVEIGNPKTTPIRRCSPHCKRNWANRLEGNHSQRTPSENQKSPRVESPCASSQTERRSDTSNSRDMMRSTERNASRKR